MRNNKTMKIIYKTFLLSVWYCCCLSLSVSTQLSTVNPFTTNMKWWNNIVDEFEMVLNIDGKRYKVSVYPQNLEDTNLFAKYIVEEIFGEIEQSESLVARIQSLLNERVDLLKDPRQEKDMKFPSRDDILFSISVSYPTNSKFILNKNRNYEYDQKTLNFYSDDSMDYAWLRFLSLNYNTFGYQRTGRFARENILRKMHRELLLDQRNKCKLDNNKCQINHCKKHLPTFNGYEMKVIKPQMQDVKKSRVVAAAVKFAVDDCVETGTYKGDTTLFLANSGACERVFTIELNKMFYENAKKRFQHEIDNGNDNARKIIPLHGDSGDVLQNSEIFKTLKDRNVLYFLDGHYSYLDTARGEEDSPIMKELEFIFNQNKIYGINVIIIDDVKEFRGSRFREGEGGSSTDEIIYYPELTSILDKLCEYDPTAFVDMEDDLLLISTNNYYHVV